MREVLYAAAVTAWAQLNGVHSPHCSMCLFCECSLLCVSSIQQRAAARLTASNCRDRPLPPPHLAHPVQAVGQQLRNVHIRLFVAAGGTQVCAGLGGATGGEEGAPPGELTASAQGGGPGQGRPHRRGMGRGARACLLLLTPQQVVGQRGTHAGVLVGTPQPDETPTR